MVRALIVLDDSGQRHKTKQSISCERTKLGGGGEKRVVHAR